MIRIYAIIISCIASGLFTSSCEKKTASVASNSSNDRESSIGPRFTGDGVFASSYFQVSGEDFGKVVIDTKTTGHLKIKNGHTSKTIRNLDLTLVNYPFALEGGSFPGRTGSCTTELAPGASCEVAFEIKAGYIRGTLSGTANFSYRVDETTHFKKVDISAKVVDLAKISTANVEFHSIEIGESPRRILSIRNLSHEKSAKNVTLTLPANSEFTILNINHHDCSSIAPNSTCLVDIEFKPTKVMAAFKEDLVINYESSGEKKTETVSISAESKNSNSVVVTDHSFGAKPIGTNGKGEITLTLKKPNGSIDANNFVLDTMASGFTVLPTSTCHNYTLTNWSKCEFKISKGPLFAETKIVNEPVKLKYEINSVPQEVLIYVDGTFTFNEATVSGQSFNQLSIAMGAFAPIRLTVWNPTNSSVGSITDFSLDNVTGVLSMDLDPTRSTCLAVGKTLRPGQNCDFVVNASPVHSQTNFSQQLNLKYQALGAAPGHALRTVPVEIKGAFDVLQFLGLKVTGQGPQTVAAPIGADMSITLTIDNVVGSSIAQAQNIDIDGIIGSPVPIAINVPKSTCLAPGAVLDRGRRCDIVLDATPNASVNLNHNMKIKYFDGVKVQKVPFTLQRDFQVLPFEGLTVLDNVFYANPVPAGDPINITLTVTNPFNGSVITAKDMKLEGMNASPVPLTVDPSSPCLSPGLDLARNQSCTFALTAIAPNATIAGYSVPLKLSYDVNGTILENNFTLEGDLNVKPPVQVGYMALSGENFSAAAPISFNKGQTFDITLTITNRGVNAGDTATSFGIERRDPHNRNKPFNWLPSFFVQEAANKSTCKATTSLKPSETCNYVLTFAPTMSADINRPFAVTFRDGTGAQQELVFDLEGKWEKIKRIKVWPKPAPAFAENTSVPRVQTSAQAKDPFYNYMFREVKQNPLVLINYPQWVWDNIPNKVFTNVDHVPFTFNLAPDNRVKLVDIVPDRITDPTTGNQYVKMYHGTTDDVLNNFTPGSQNIGFDFAEITALGDGFYLAANANESKAYACSRYNERKGAGVVSGAVLLVIGIQVDDAIVGKEIEPTIGRKLSFNKGQARANNKITAGAPIDDSIYFGRNKKWHNQFVFFSNAKPYMRIFDIIELGDGFGMARSYDDHDGQAQSATTQAPAYCTY